MAGGDEGIKDDPVVMRLTGTSGSTGLLLNNTAAITFAAGTESSKTIKNIITLGIKEETPLVIPADFTAVVKVKIEYGPNASSVNTISSQTLTVTYTKAEGLKYNARNYFHFDGAAYVKITLVEVPSNLSGTIDVRNLIYVENEMRVTRYYKLSTNLATLKPATFTHTAPAAGADEMDVAWTWQAGTGHNAAQLEWSWVEDELITNYYSGGSLDSNLLFKLNATRIDLPYNRNSYKIPLLYGGKGKLFFRVRPVNQRTSGTRTDGPWSWVRSQAFNGHDSTLNWQSTITFAEEGKRKAVMQYYDGSLRSRQTVTKDNVTNTVVSGETLYDGQGRPAVQVLPVPGTGTTIKYTNDLNFFSGQLTLAEDPGKFFDLQPIATPNSLTTPMDTTRGAAKYYSALNPELATGSNNTIPKAEGFPYTYTRYTPDGTGRVMAKSGVGAAFQMGKGHETKYYYGSASQEMLDGLFGTEVGIYSHYFKNMVRDANGQMSISYVDMHGRTIATALAGESPANLAALDLNATSYPNQAGRYVTQNLLSGSTNLVKNNSIEAINTLLVPARGLYNFRYELNPQSLQLTVGTAVCYDCMYNLEISITDESGDTPPIVKKYNNINPTADDNCATAIKQFENDTTGTVSNIAQFAVTLEPGSYIVRKSLTLSEASLQKYREEYLTKAIGKTEQQVIDSLHAVMKVASGCATAPPVVTCKTCLDSLGTLGVYKTKYLNSIGNPAVTPQMDSSIKYNYKADSLACSRMCDTLSHDLEIKRLMMLADMMPYSGQYARDFVPVGTNAINLYNKYNIFSTYTPATQPFYKKPKNGNKVVDYYRTDDMIIDPVIHPDPANLNAKLNVTTKAEFEAMFTSSWAEQLLPYHPEYDKLLFAEANLAASYNWMTNFNRVTTYADATAKGYIFTSAANITDPLYSKVPAADKTIMATKVGTDLSGGLSIWQMAYGNVKCKDIISPDHQKACYLGAPKIPPYNDLTTAEKDQIWATFKTLYGNERDSSLIAYINSNNPLTDAQTLVDEKYILQFPLSNKQLAQQAGADWNWYPATTGGAPNLAGLPGGSTPQDVYASRCASYIDQWKKALERCAVLAAKPNKDAIITSITDGMKAVCIKGSDAANPYGSSNVAPTTPVDGSPRSFEEVINAVFAANSISIDSLCNPFVMEFPKPYGKGTAFIADQVTIVDTCNCNRFAQLKAEATAAGKDPNVLTSMNQYLSTAYGDTLTTALYSAMVLNCSKLSTTACIDSIIRTPISCAEVLTCDCALVNISGTCYKDCVKRVCTTTGSSFALSAPQPFPDFLKCGSMTASKCFDCAQISALVTEFKAIYPAPYDSGPDFAGTNLTPATLRNNILFEQFVNYRTGYQYSWIEYSKAATAATCNLANYASNSALHQSVICRPVKPLTDTTGLFVLDSACEKTYNTAVFAGQGIYQARKDLLLARFDSLYRDKCMSAKNIETFAVSDTVKEYHYTLYYYDMAGNLVKTVPPAGVRPDFGATFLNSVKTARAAGTSVPRTHLLVTNYRYNSLNAPVQQNSPDAKKSKFWYDRLGRLAVSQNAQQALDAEYSYTLYDVFGRITEVGQKPQTTVMTQTISQDTTALKDWVLTTGGVREQITQTVYDLPYGYSAQYPQGILYGAKLTQRNLRGRVSYATTMNLATDPLHYTGTFYTYDVHGNVDTLLQDYNGVAETGTTDRFKKVVYEYDLVSGKVNTVQYQPDLDDAFYHRYSYDAENRLTRVETSRDKVYWEEDARYNYFKHGPLARTELGQLKVQGLDYAYTLQGWLKGVNSTTVSDGTYDVGKDGKSGSSNVNTARDIFGFALHYYDGVENGNTWVDYLPIGTASNFARVDAGHSFVSLYNGNISAMTVNNAGLTRGVPANTNSLPLMYRYSYDQLNRLVGMQTYKGLTPATNTWTPEPLNDYKEVVKYDPNGNIVYYNRRGAPEIGKPLLMDSLSYVYWSGTNQLRQIRDNSGYTSNYTEDINHQAKTNNYLYDSTGNLVMDSSESNMAVTWTVYGKIATINKGGNIITYTYDATGNRITKTASGKTTLYVRDASGNVLAVYEKTASTAIKQTEVDLYGSSRLGILNELTVAPTAVALASGYNPAKVSVFSRSEKVFELSNHLGNVLVTITDKRTPVDAATDGNLDFYTANVVTAQDCYPFGMLMPGRTYNADLYKYGFNGKENDNDVKGIGNQQDYGMRIYDPRIGRFLSVDPISEKYPMLTPFQFSSDNPIQNIDIDGLEGGSSNGAPTTTNLYHVTTPENAESIIKKGFNATENGTYSNYSWFSPKSSATGTGVPFDQEKNVEIKVKGVDTKGAYVITNSKVAEIEQQAFKSLTQEFGSFNSLDEAKSALSSNKYNAFRRRFYGTKYNLLGQFMDNLKQPSYFLESEGTFAFSDAALKGKVQLWGFKGKAAGVLAKGLNGLKYAGKTLIVVGVATDIYEIATTQNISKTITRKAGGWAGATLGAEGGAAVGAWFGGWGAIPGAIIGGAIGYWSGEKVTETIYEKLETSGWVPSGKE
ncbi:hypothetical protein FPE01S_03_01410 [Flavihumibacter petaseus NBRC 106054]|uniref:RHS repeat-associated core domain-containing protein n=2 Tax=Flavihumibacter TaxID=1004301 RepID=A0A0E9N246_9BACT|nr:hypothetical protein FPE01S_03_01410 [Flavihumibacter petaseus NBRC 106054]